MGILSRIATWLGGSAKGAPSAYASGGHGSGGLGSLDAFRKHRAPSPGELLAEHLGTAFACAGLNADLLSSTPLRLYVTTGRGEAQAKMSKRGDTRAVRGKRLERLKANPPSGSKVRKAREVEEVLDHPILDLLNRPNPLADGVGLSMFELFNFTQLYQEVVGRAYWYCERDGIAGTPSAIWILAAHQVREVCDGQSERVIDAYEFAGRDRYLPEQVVPFRMPDLRNPYTGGISPLRSVIEQVRISRKIDAHTGALLDNQARPDALFIPKGSAEGYDIGEVQAARLESMINKRFRTAGRGGIMVAEHDGQIHPLQWPTRDITDLEQVKLTKSMIANGFAVPTTKLDRNEANLAGAQTGDYAHAKDAGVPRCQRNQAALNAFFVPMWDPTGRLFLAYDSPIPEDAEAAREDRKVMVSAGSITGNELRGEYGLDEREDMDAPVSEKPGTSITLAQAGDGTEGGDDDKPDPKAAEHQSDAVTDNDLRATVGGSAAVLALQEAFYAGQMPREAAIANATLVFGFKPAEADQLFPATAPDAPKREVDDVEQPKPVQQDDPAAGEDPDGDAKPPKPKGGKAIVGNVGGDGLAGPLPQGRKIAAALKRVFARQRAAVLEQLDGKSIEDVEGKLIERMAGAGKAVDSPAALHATLRAHHGKAAGQPNQDDLPTTFVDLSAWDGTLADAVRPLIELVAVAGAKQTIARVGASADVFSVVERNIPAAVEQLTLAFAKSTNRTTSLAINDAIGKLRDELTAGLVEGDTRAEMVERVSGVFELAETSRAATIAKTEASRAQHTGELMSAKASGVITKKKWLASADACDECLAIADANPDGIDLDEPFATTAYGPVTTPPLHPNCQCSETFEVAEPADEE